MRGSIRKPTNFKEAKLQHSPQRAKYRTLISLSQKERFCGGKYPFHKVYTTLLKWRLYCCISLLEYSLYRLDSFFLKTRLQQCYKDVLRIIKSCHKPGRKQNNHTHHTPKQLASSVLKRTVCFRMTVVVLCSEFLISKFIICHITAHLADSTFKSFHY